MAESGSPSKRGVFWRQVVPVGVPNLTSPFAWRPSRSLQVGGLWRPYFRLRLRPLLTRRFIRGHSCAPGLHGALHLDVALTLWQQKLTQFYQRKVMLNTLIRCSYSPGSFSQRRGPAFPPSSADSSTGGSRVRIRQQARGRIGSAGSQCAQTCLTLRQKTTGIPDET